MSTSKGTLLVTGTNGGLGSAIVSKIASTPDLAGYHGLYTVRNASTATALNAVLQAAPHPHAHDVLSLDLTQLDKVREVATAINKRVASGELKPIRALICNAGYQEHASQTWTDDGFDTSFKANYLGHWLLTLMLLQSMDRERGRIVVLGSWSHDGNDPHNANGIYPTEEWKTIFHDSTEPIAKGTWSTLKDDSSWRSGFRRYGASKLCQVMMIRELQRRLDTDPVLSNICVLGVDPGAMSTGIARRQQWLINFIIFKIVVPIATAIMSHINPNGTFRTTTKSAADVLAAGLDCNPVLGEKPKCLYLQGSELARMSPEAEDPKKLSILWSDSIQYAGLKEGDTLLVNWQ